MFHRVIGLSLLISATSWASTIRTDRSDSLYLNLGNSAAYQSVGQILGADASSSFAASAVLLNSNWALTAAHVTSGATSLNFTVGGSSHAASSWITNPNWTGNLNAGYDLGLIYFANGISNVAAATRYTGSAEKGKVATYVGYGTTGTGATGWQPISSFSQLQKRGVQNTVDVIYNTRILESDFDNPTAKYQKRDNVMGSGAPLNLEGLIAPGDSGGGVFMNISGIDYLVGINSFGASKDGKTNSDYGDYSGAIRVSVFNSWIDSVISGFSSGSTLAYSPQGGAYDLDSAFGASPVPSPAAGSLGMILFGMLALARRRSAV